MPKCCQLFCQRRHKVKREFVKGLLYKFEKETGEDGSHLLQASTSLFVKKWVYLQISIDVVLTLRTLAPCANANFNSAKIQQS